MNTVESKQDPLQPHKHSALLSDEVQMSFSQNNISKQTLSNPIPSEVLNTLAGSLSPSFAALPPSLSCQCRSRLPHLEAPSHRRRPASSIHSLSLQSNLLLRALSAVVSTHSAAAGVRCICSSFSTFRRCLSKFLGFYFDY
ncbi:hypothetical protein PIB30_058555 [Stylosanthes scabra]|uniref:Uncharacterized protein n=1 Tax=Stylosanthes scabra TaxID=79078 RepID=A0ABU6VJT6_9FABA|nr:hypothetical protein [Stylosanthes scabra]